MTAPLYVRVLGEGWTRIAEPVRRAHDAGSIVRARGRLRVEHGDGTLARVLARLLRLPAPSAGAETRLVVTRRGGGEHWLRTFDGRRLETRQCARGESELSERFGPLELRFRLEASDGGLLYVQREAAFLLGPVRVRIPRRWAPRVEAREDGAGPQRIRIAVRVTLPGAGLLLAYGGVLELEDETA